MVFLPPGFAARDLETSLGPMVYYTQSSELWGNGSDRPPLVFLHGFGGGSSAYEWSKVYPAFASTHQIIAPDLIGWGQSAHPIRDYQISDYLTTLTEFLTQVSQATPVTVAAASLTGGFALRIARDNPHLFKALFLTCPSGFADFGQDAGRRLPLQVINTPLLDRLIYALGATNEIAVRRFLEQFLFSRSERLSEEVVAAYLESAQQPNAEYAALAFLRGDLYFDLARYLEGLTVRTAIAWGENAQFTPLTLGERLAKLNPAAIQAFYRIPDAGVLPQLEQAGAIAGLLQRFLSSQT